MAESVLAAPADASRAPVADAAGALTTGAAGALTAGAADALTAGAADVPGTDAGHGIYLHVPFCARRCDYCDFNTYADRGELMPDYVRALRADIAAVAVAGPTAVAPPGATTDRTWPTFTSVFVGGGTPTLLSAADLAAVLDDVATMLPLASDAEITVEANPETVTVDGMNALAAAGVNRVSMGAQSFAPHVLEALGRWHEPDAPLRAVQACRDAGIDRLSLDLIYGTPGERDSDWDTTVRIALGTGIDHLSAYALTVEPNTAYAARVRRGAAAAPDDDVQATRMEQVDALARAAGLRRYELSNWARPGAESVHNGTYWRGGQWLGIGAGAHGHWHGRRWWNVRSPQRYIAAALSGAATAAGFELPDAEQRRVERLMMGLRTTEGVARADVALLDDAKISHLVAAGLLTANDQRIALTADGMRLASAVIVSLA